MGILDLVFPKRCINCKTLGDYLCPSCFSYLSFNTKSLCLVCGKQSFSGLTHKKCKGKYTIDGCFSALKYNHIARKLIFQFKNKPYLLDLQDFLSELFYESLIQNEGFVKLIQKRNYVFIPIPLSSKEYRKRGYNQAQILAKKMSQKFKIKVLDIKNIDKNISNTFLIDDVIKTGKTLKVTAEILKRKGVKKVFGLIFAGN
ncbi:MAG: ComF family protein [Candidatus Levybacteria bacterium]|nr:ComF family protein [Candidatus Levybacteria bacterium]